MNNACTLSMVKGDRPRRGALRVPSARRGMALVLVLIVVALLALGGYTFSESMFTERRAAHAHGQRLRALAAAESGVAAAMRFLVQDPLLQAEYGGTYDNPLLFRGKLIADGPEATDRLRFSLIAPAQLDGYLFDVRFGIEDESARINLNALVELTSQNESSGSSSSSSSSSDLSSSALGELSGDLFSMESELSLGSSPAASVLMRLPGMTEDVADAILDWIDEDSEPRPLGAEADYYASLMPPYAPANGPIKSIEDLLLVRGVTAQMLFGLDQDRNGVIDMRERAFEAELGIDNSDGAMDFGWSAYLTLHSAEGNNQQGMPRINLNSEDLTQLHTELSELFDPEWADFIIAYRQYGPDSQSSSGSSQPGAGSSREGGSTIGFAVDPSQPASVEISSILDLIDARVRIGESGGDDEGNSSEDDESRGRGSRGGEDRQGDSSDRGDDFSENNNDDQSGDDASSGGGRGGGRGGDRSGGGGGRGSGDDEEEGEDSSETVLESPFLSDPAEMNAYLPLLLEATTVSPEAVIRGRININQAPRIVLEAIPGIAPETVEAIIANRISEAGAELPERQHPTWLLTEGLVDLETMKQLMPFVTTQGGVYRTTVVGYTDAPGPGVRLEVLIDATLGTPRILSWRDMSHLGIGHSKSILGGEF